MKGGDRIIVVRQFMDDDPEDLIGMRGSVIEQSGDFVRVFLDGDNYPSTFHKDEVEREAATS